MKLFLVRHGETVDNVAGLYAGVRDSALTNYGVEQANKLGAYLAKVGIQATHIFASPLTRAYKTAEAVQKAQLASKTDAIRRELPIVKVQALIEQDFGFYEGKPFYLRSDPKKTGRQAHHEKHKSDTGFVDIESKDSMATRADMFLNEHLLPLFETECRHAQQVVIAVSHGILLSHLWRRLLLRLPRKSLTIAAEVLAARDNIVLEHLGGWSNTGYLELLICKEIDERTEGKEGESPDIKLVSSSIGVAPSLGPASVLVQSPMSLAPMTREVEETSTPTAAKPHQLEGYATKILAIDSKLHLQGLKRQRGGIGRLAHDEGQKKLDGFFKKQRRD